MPASSCSFVGCRYRAARHQIDKPVPRAALKIEDIWVFRGLDISVESRFEHRLPLRLSIDARESVAKAVFRDPWDARRSGRIGHWKENTTPLHTRSEKKQKGNHRPRTHRSKALTSNHHHGTTS